MTTREQAMTKLFTLLSGSSSYKIASRRFKTYDQIADSDKPALLMCEPDEKHDRGERATPARRTLNVEIWIYIADGLDPEAVPATTLNNLIDAIDPVSGGVLKPDRMQQNRLTLGGLVYDCFIDGEIKKIPGDLDGQGIALIPVKIIFQQAQ